MEQENLLVVPTCFDGVLNQDEEEIDCGGRCTACIFIPPIEVPCAAELKANFLDLYYHEMSLTSDDYNVTEEDGITEVYIYKNSIEIRIIIQSTLPQEDMRYEVVHPWEIESGQTSMQVIDWSTTFRSTTGEMYIIFENGELTLQFCAVNMNYSGGNFLASGKIVL